MPSGGDRWTYDRTSPLRPLSGGATCARLPGVAIVAEGRIPRPTPRAIPQQRPRSDATVVPYDGAVLPATAAAAGAAACAAVGLGLWANSLRDEGVEQRVVPMTGGGSLIVDDGRATIVACVEEPPAGKTYEAWVIEEGTPRPAGLFSGGCRSVPLERPVGEGDTSP